MQDDENIIQELANLPLEDYKIFMQDVHDSKPIDNFDEAARRRHISNPVRPSMLLKGTHYIHTCQWLDNYKEQQKKRVSYKLKPIVKNIGMTAIGVIVTLLITKSCEHIDTKPNAIPTTNQQSTQNNKIILNFLSNLPYSTNEKLDSCEYIKLYNVTYSAEIDKEITRRWQAMAEFTKDKVPTPMEYEPSQFVIGVVSKKDNHDEIVRAWQTETMNILGIYKGITVEPVKRAYIFPKALTLDIWVLSEGQPL